MAWKKMKGGSRGRSSSQMISLRKSGSIGINSKTLEEHFNGYEHAEVFFDDENNKLGFKPVEEPTDESYTLHRSNGSGVLTPTSILKDNDLIPEQTTQFAPEIEQPGNYTLIAVDLDDPVRKYGSAEDEESDPPEDQESE